MLETNMQVEAFRPLLLAWYFTSFVQTGYWKVKPLWINNLWNNISTTFSGYFEQDFSA